MVSGYLFARCCGFDVVVRCSRVKDGHVVVICQDGVIVFVSMADNLFGCGVLGGGRKYGKCFVI